MASTVGGVLITVAIVRANRDGKGDWGEGWNNTERARALLDSGIIDTRSNLGVEVGVVMSNPDTFEQMNTNVADGGGPTLSAVAQAATLPPAVVARHWTSTRQAYGPVETEDDAFRFSLLFMARLARDLTVDPTLASGMLWELARERAQPNFPEDADTHRWLASWMGVPLGSAIMASQFAFSDANGRIPPDMRSRIYAEPFPLLDRLAADIGNRHPKEVDGRVRGLVDNVRPWWPTDEVIPPAAPEPAPPEMTRPDEPAIPEDERDKPEAEGTP